jgi:hypothetical protein
MVVKWNSRIRGSVLLLSVIFSLLIISLLLFLFPLNNFIFKYYSKISEERVVDSQIRGAQKLFLINTSLGDQINYCQSNYFDSTIVEVEKWGVFQLLSIKSKLKGIEKEHVYLVGQDMHLATDSLTLLVPEIQTPIICTGSATIEGRIKIPRQGIKSNYLDGTYFSGSIKFAKIAGTTKDSLPTVSDFFSDAINLFSSPNQLASLYSTEIQYAQFSLDSINVPFDNTPALFYSDQSIEINNFIKGKAVIMSGTSITLQSKSSLFDVVVVAPVVTIKNGFEGNLQVIATDSITVESNVKLHYPSVLIINQKKNTVPANLFVGNGSLIDGAVVVTRPSGLPYYFFPKVKIDDQATVRGIFYAQGLSDIRGTIVGTTFTEHFLYRSSTGFYLNHFRNGNLHFADLPNQYSIPFIFENSWRKCLLKRLY